MHETRLLRARQDQDKVVSFFTGLWTLYPGLLQLGRSIQEPPVQQVYRQYAQAMSSIVRPAYLGLAAETNLIRQVAPQPLYEALVRMTNDAAADLRAGGSSSTPYVSVQVDVAWGRIINSNVYLGVEDDFRDFPFMQALGLSSYPYFAFPEPEDVPLDYYSRLTNGRTLPVLVVEGGWTSGSVGTVQSSPDKQTRYFRRQSALLDSVKAKGVFQSRDACVRFVYLLRRPRERRWGAARFARPSNPFTKAITSRRTS